jgi:Tol biopolymer transport system component
LIGVDLSRLVLSNPDGTGRRVFSATAGARLPVWSPDGRYVYYLTRRTLRTLRYRDRDGNPFEIQVNRASIEKVDVMSGQIRTLLTLPVHAFANLAMSPDGRWLYFAQVTNSDLLYQQLVRKAKVTNELLARNGPRTAVLRILSAGGRPQMIAQDSGQVAVPGSSGL